MKLSDKIWVCRKKAGLSQEALAEKIGVSRQAISKWETGEAAPEITKLPLLARTFQVTADWLLDDEAGFDEDVPEEEPVPEASAPEEPVGATIDRPSPEPVQTYPEWIDHLPGVLGRMLKKYGWIFGVRMAISGALFTGMGMVGKAMFNSMTSSFGMDGLFPATPYSGVTFYDEAGNVIDPSQWDMFSSAVQSMGAGSSPGYSPFGGMNLSVSMSNPADILCNFIIVIGLVMLIGGLFLAWYLKKKGQESL